MTKYLVLYLAPKSATDQMAQANSPEEAAKAMEPWLAWQKKHEGKIVDFGMPVDEGKKIVKGGGVEESGTKIAGYSIIQADNKEAAIEMVKEHPHLQWVEGAEVEVHEFLPLPGMEG